MKLAFVTPGGVDRSGIVNITPALLWQIERLARQHALHIFALHQYAQPCTYSLLGATVHNLGWPRGRGALAQAMLRLPELVRALQRVGPFDLVHGWWGQPAIGAAAFAGRICRTPVVTTLVGGELIALPHIRYGGRLTPQSRVMMHLALNLSKTIVVLSDVLQQEAQALGFTSSVIPFGVEPSCFLDVKPRTPNAKPKLLHVASINRIKDQATLLRAMQRVMREIPETTLDLIGVDTLRGEMQRLAEQLGISTGVRFHGFLTQEAIRPFWREADLFVLSSLHEGQCVAVCEAAAAGVPTVGTRVGLLAEWAPDLASAVPVGDDAALASEIVSLLRDPSRRAQLATAARAWAAAHDADWTNGQIESVYSKYV
jgi:glycosyltransferase involved in cell wall biosynthesis